MQLPPSLINIFNQILEALGNVGWIPWILLFLLVFIWLLTVWRSIAPGWRGVSYGVYKLIIKFGPKFYRTIHGNLTDITDFELGPHYLEEYRKYALENIQTLLKSELNPEQRKDLEKLRDKLKQPLTTENFRCIGVRTGKAKHLFLTILNPDHSFPGDYALLESKAKFSLSLLDFANRGTIIGRGYTLPSEKGKPFLHIFLPEPITNPIEDSKSLEARLAELEDLAKLPTIVRPTVQLQQQLKAKDQLVKTYDLTLKRVLAEANKLKNQLDLARRALTQKPLIPETPEEKAIKGVTLPAEVSFLNIIIIILGGVLIGWYFFPQYIPHVTRELGALLGMIISLIVYRFFIKGRR